MIRRSTIGFGQPSLRHKMQTRLAIELRSSSVATRESESKFPVLCFPFRSLLCRLALCVMVMGATSAHADDFAYPYLVLEGADGTQTSVSVQSLTLTPAEGLLTARNAEGTWSLSLAGLSKMYFSTTPTGIVPPVRGEEEEVEVFTLAGLSAGVFENVGKAQQALPRGVYIVKSRSKTIKMTVR